jgi:hypothetical protein
MADLKLAKIPDRTPVKIAISITPSLHADLLDYAGVYAAAYGEEAQVADLVPFMLAAFVEGDRAFQQARRGLAASREGASR